MLVNEAFRRRKTGSTATATDYAAYLTEYEGADTDEEADFDPSDPFDDEDEDQLQDVTQFLTDQAFLHQVTGEDIYADNAPKTPSNQFLIEDRYAGRFKASFQIPVQPTSRLSDTWEALRCLWIDTYQGPPDVVTHDAGTNFASTEFQTEAKMLGITCKEVPIEAHWSIGKVERYHGPLRRAFEIMYAELSSQADADSILELRDISQAYTHSTTGLARLVLTYLPIELQDKYPKGTIIRIVRPLYGIAEAGLHWFATYHKHHREQLRMSTSTFDPCLLITNTDPNQAFGIVGMQTDDT
ncbi:hypothetical protein HRG_009718 [Hirsutella rhossiliensis]|uniref:Integrase catalytic domain-containing protein n=1 Tax=Hirsutella rhossiliensis TaxID=111463 RepID=A0A9P8MQJ4_9HYPO|nr:uncharacterized protein HRG_09718 [Hirsutella rhossiliensis]KAH0959257.1 hypothetical protein HRG_09718 [Hirsutella rhossiliensis]